MSAAGFSAPPLPQDTARSCPSAPAEPGAPLIGILGPDGRMHNLRTSVAVDEDFLAAARLQGPPEARMRFAGRCREGACGQWTGHSCGVIERVLGALAVEEQAELPPCTLRATCRWFSQEGRVACAACALVVTDTRVAAE